MRARPVLAALSAVLGLVFALEGPAAAADPVSCARIQKSLAAKKVVVLSFVSSSFARGCKDNETCGDWLEYLGKWRSGHQTDGDAITVTPGQRAALLRKGTVIPSFATVLLAPDGGAAIYRGAAVEPQVYETLNQVARGQSVDPAWASTVEKWTRALLRCF